MVKKIFCTFFLLCLSSVGIKASTIDSSPFLYINQIPADLSISQDQIEIEKLKASLSKETDSSLSEDYVYVIKEIVDSGKYILLEDESLWLVGSSYRGAVKKWNAKDRLKLSYHSKYSNNIKFENIDKKNVAWGVIEKKPQAGSTFILRLSNSVFDSDKESKLILNNGLIFKGPKIAWKVREEVIIFHSVQPGYYDIWNLARNEINSQWKLVGDEKMGSGESLFNIETLLGNRVLGQQEAIKCISATIFNCWIGLNDPQLPLGVFLFLGPTGVGKTELAKALTHELYKDQSRLIRFDMSQFPLKYDYTRLIGSPPGYVDHDKGGQLTEALKTKPQSIVLLDEIEKAAPEIRKAFLPIFDEGYIADASNTLIPCNRAIFIMTGNICSQEIALLFNQGYSSEEVVKMIEPEVVKLLSPELYNRATTVVFRPVDSDIMTNLVDQKLNEVVKQLKKQKGIDLVIDDTVRSYLITEGFHPTLGVRPLKRLIQSKVIGSVSYAIIRDGIPDGSTLKLSYSSDDDSWNIDWK